MENSQYQPRIHILGTPRRNYEDNDPDQVAEERNRRVEEEEKRKELENKLKVKRQPKVIQPSPQPYSPTIIAPADFSDAFFLGEEFGREINTKIQERYGEYNAIKVIVFDDDKKVVTGSNPFYVVAVNEFLQEGIRTATQADLERILRENKLPLQGHYEDSSLVLRTKQEPNSYLATDLFNQFKQRGINLDETTAYVIPLNSLTLRKDEQSPSKLSFTLPENPVYFQAEILNSPSQNKFESSDIEENTGIPKEVRAHGSRTLYTRNGPGYSFKNSGISGLYLGRSLSLNSSNGGLADSNDYGRVVCLRAKGTHGAQKNGGKQ